jgi:hypothetical protein
VEQPISQWTFLGHVLCLLGFFQSRLDTKPCIESGADVGSRQQRVYPKNEQGLACESYRGGEVLDSFSSDTGMLLSLSPPLTSAYENSFLQDVPQLATGIFLLIVESKFNITTAVLLTTSFLSVLYTVLSRVVSLLTTPQRVHPQPEVPPDVDTVANGYFEIIKRENRKEI